MSRAHGFCFTINNYTEEDIKKCQKLLAEADYGIIGKECGQSGTKHIQGYGYWKNKKCFGSLQKFFGNAHIEQAQGNPKQNKTYCSKENNYEEFGEIPSQGSRNDIAEFRDSILSGMTEEELIMEYPIMMAKYDRFYQRCRNIVLKKEAQKMNPVDVTVITGETGIGKTHMVYAENDINDIYKAEVGDGSSGSIFWDNYNGESVILIDDFHNNFKLDYMLRLLDKYPMKLNIKGGYTWKCAKKIYITSNINVDDWYRYCPVEHRKALRRRINNIIIKTEQVQ